MIQRTKIGIIGCGNISDAYFRGCRLFDSLEISACADIRLEAAQTKAHQHAIPRACTVEELLEDPEIEIVVNLTIPAAHTTVNLQAIAAGKHVYVEKPFALDCEAAGKVIRAARAQGVRVGSAPDTFLGEGIQTARSLLDQGAIGEPVGATAFWAFHGHESWHPAPEFYYKAGGGPMLDMGPYYLTALVNLLGPIRRVSGSARKSFSERTITSEPLCGSKISVEVPTHYSGTVDFSSGPIGTVLMSFDVAGHNLPMLEIHGSEASLVVPDPNGFGGPMMVRRRGGSRWKEIPLVDKGKCTRGIGVADMAFAIRSGQEHRASGELALHVLEVMLAFETSSEQGCHIEIQNPCQRPAALSMECRDSIGQLL